jgi:hypothetical protein
MDEITIGNFLFVYFKQSEGRVIYKVYYCNNKTQLQDDQKDSLVEMLKENIGKWEAFMRAVTDTGFVGKVGLSDFQYTKYDIKDHYDVNDLTIEFTVKHEELENRTVDGDRTGKGVKLTENEITGQLRNIQKWRNLKLALGFLKSA